MLSVVNSRFKRRSDFADLNSCLINSLVGCFGWSSNWLVVLCFILYCFLFCFYFLFFCFPFHLLVIVVSSSFFLLSFGYCFLICFHFCFSSLLFNFLFLSLILWLFFCDCFSVVLVLLLLFFFLSLLLPFTSLLDTVSYVSFILAPTCFFSNFFVKVDFYGWYYFIFCFSFSFLLSSLVIFSFSFLSFPLRHLFLPCFHLSFSFRF